MSRDLNETLRRFAAAEHSKLKYRGLQWPEFEAFLGSLQKLERICDELTPPQIVDTWLAILRFARRILRSSPTNPRYPALQLAKFVDVDTTPFPPEIRARFADCQLSVTSLLLSDVHPTWDHIESLLSAANASNKEIKIKTLVAKGAVPFVEEISKEHGWKLTVLDLTAAKRADVADLALIFGSPELHTHWQDDFDTSSRKVAWLFNAPIADETHVLSWPGSFKFDAKRYTAWEGAPLQDVSLSGSTSFVIDVNRFTEISSGSSTPPAIVDASTGHIEPVQATPIKLTDNTWVFLSNEVGPKASYLDTDDFNVIERVAKNLKDLTPGTVLILRDGDTGRSFLESEAANWIDEKHGVSQRKKSVAVRNEFRSAVQELGRDQFAIKRLKDQGLDEGQARRRLRLAHDPLHIAPEDKTEFAAICKAANCTLTEEDAAHLVILRTAYRQAGHRARVRLLEAIEADPSWQVTIETPAQARIAIPGVGSTILAPIIAVLPNTVPVPISRLGHIEKDKKGIT
jgi:hypothetical protein